jgi:hypothetical protein
MKLITRLHTPDGTINENPLTLVDFTEFSEDIQETIITLLTPEDQKAVRDVYKQERELITSRQQLIGNIYSRITNEIKIKHPEHFI